MGNSTTKLHVYPMYLNQIEVESLDKASKPLYEQM